VALAIFDLDNTLLAGDSDYLWGVYLSQAGAVERAHYERENDRFYAEYKAGTLDIMEFLRFSLAPLQQHSPAELLRWRTDFMQQMIEPIILPAAEALLARHRADGDTLMIITATNSFVTAPIAERLGIEYLIATNPEMIDGHYTGEVVGIPSFKQGKVERLQQWLMQNKRNLHGSSFYGDSHNDIPLLERVEQAVAVDPDSELAAHARRCAWPIISLRNQPERVNSQ